MTKRTAKLGLIGLGQRGQELLDGVIFPLQNQVFDLIAACDSYADRVEDTKKAALEKAGVAMFGTTDYREILSRPDIGPVDFLFSAMRLLASDTDTIAAEPRPQSVDMPDFQNHQEFDLGNGSWMHSYDYKDEHVSSILRLQSWTLRRYGDL